MKKQKAISELIDIYEEREARGLKELRWAFPLSGTLQHPGNVTVLPRKKGYVISFRNDARKKFKLDQVIFAIEDDRLYFSEHEKGYKFMKNSGTKEEIRTRRDLGEFVGDYFLRYDEALKLYYIDRSNKDADKVNIDRYFDAREGG